MIVVEGPDGAGKSTLINRLIEDLEKRGVTLLRKDRENRDVPKDPMMMAFEALAEGCKFTENPVKYSPVIHDRLIFSELIYGHITRGKIQPGYLAFSKVITRALNTLMVPVIICLPSYEEVVNNLLKTEQPGFVDENIESIYLGYLDLVNTLGDVNPVQDGFPLLVYDYTATKSAWKIPQLSHNYGIDWRPSGIEPASWLTTCYEDVLNVIESGIINQQRLHRYKERSHDPSSN